ncbi:MAG: GDP-mannose 4,6-dehydratase [bacterium]|nr:GDP-mannose 4,6-dehydratase [bacterium]
MQVLVTGGAGFIGSTLIKRLLQADNVSVVNVDKLSYAGDLESLEVVADDKRYHFEKVDICDAPKVRSLFEKYQPDAVMHLAAESHVDRSIDDPKDFVETNVNGTVNLLEAARNHWSTLDQKTSKQFRFLHVSTDEVYGSLGPAGLFTEDSPYRPNSPYSASKASADHLVRAWHATYDIPILITNCSNNYGPYQFPEKLIPVIIHAAISGENIPIYGKGAFRNNEVRLHLHALAYNLGNFQRTLALPDEVEHWSLTTLREKFIKISARVVKHSRYVTFQLAEVAIPRTLFAETLRLIDGLRPASLPP